MELIREVRLADVVWGLATVCFAGSASINALLEEGGDADAMLWCCELCASIPSACFASPN
jgi:hypothetical protein